MNRAKIAVGISGGVDSAVSALLLKKQGFDVVGVHLYCYPAKSEVEKDGLTREEWIKRNGCRADEDKRAALKTALELSIPFKTLDFSEEYNKRVVDYFYREYEAGRTPNPDVLCNSEIKFGLFLDWALANGLDYVATGHYAKLCASDSSTSNLENGSVFRPAAESASYAAKNPASKQEPSFFALRNVSNMDDGFHQNLALSIPADKHKDQTYFLWKLTQKEMAHVIFPLAGLMKPEVRKIAKEARLSVANRPDSQGICFVGNVDARKFLARRLKEKTGEVKNTDGEVIGFHKGVWFYTIGQRGGWDIDPKAQKLKTEKTQKGDVTPIFYVISKDAGKNELVVGIGDETKSQKFGLSEENWLGEKDKVTCVRIRHGGKLIPATILANEVTLTEPQRGIAPGQSAVFYDEQGQVLGGGVIE